MTDLQTFHLFPDLPTELRLKIYAHTLPPPSLIPIRFSSIPTPHYHTNTHFSPLLHATRESRALYLRTHTLLALSPKYPSAIYLDFEHDTLFFDTLECSPDGDLAGDLAKCPQRGKIRRVAIDAQLWEVLRVFKFECLSEVKVLPGLNSLALVLKRERERERRREGGEGRDVGMGMGMGQIVVEGANTVEQEIMNVRWYAESLRWEIENVGEDIWISGRPNVQIWLW